MIAAMAAIIFTATKSPSCASLLQVGHLLLRITTKNPFKAHTDTHHCEFLSANQLLTQYMQRMSEKRKHIVYHDDKGNM